jgi:hypothetical protein
MRTSQFIFRTSKSIRANLLICHKCEKHFEFGDNVFSSNSKRYHKKCAESLNFDVSN